MGDIIKLNDADKSADLHAPLRHHASQAVEQRFQVVRTRARRCKPLKLEAVEQILKDQFGNLYVAFFARLADGELYGSYAYVGKEKWTDEGKREVILVREWKKWKRWDDDLMNAIQQLAFVAFGRAQLAIYKGRHAAQLVTDVPLGTANATPVEVKAKPSPAIALTAAPEPAKPTGPVTAKAS